MVPEPKEFQNMALASGPCWEGRDQMSPFIFFVKCICSQDRLEGPMLSQFEALLSKQEDCMLSIPQPGGSSHSPTHPTRDSSGGKGKVAWGEGGEGGRLTMCLPSHPEGKAWMVGAWREHWHLPNRGGFRKDPLPSLLTQWVDPLGRA